MYAWPVRVNLKVYILLVYIIENCDIVIKKIPAVKNIYVICLLRVFIILQNNIFEVLVSLKNRGDCLKYRALIAKYKYQNLLVL